MVKVDFNEGFQEKLVQVNWVVKVVKGGCIFGFIVLIVVGDGKGKVGFGCGKVCEVFVVIQKVLEVVCCNMIQVDLKGIIIQYLIKVCYGVFKVYMQFVDDGIGVIVGGVMCVVLEVVGVQNVLVKCYGFINLVNVVCVMFNGLK